MLALVLAFAHAEEGPYVNPPERPHWELNLRYRRLWLPGAILDNWYYDDDDPGALDYERPAVGAAGPGFEVIFKAADNHWCAYYEFLGNRTDEGYWDDVEDEDEETDHYDGLWIRPVDVGFHVGGLGYQRNVPITGRDQPVWFSVLFGGGLGLVFATGEFEAWYAGLSPDNPNPDCGLEEASYDRVGLCPVDDTFAPPGLLPMVDLTMSGQLHFADRVNLRLDFGVHDMVYAGLALGGEI